jgi:hypothetical protein
VVSPEGVNETYVAGTKKKELCLEGREVKMSSNSWIWIFVLIFFRFKHIIGLSRIRSTTFGSMV